MTAVSAAVSCTAWESSTGLPTPFSISQRAVISSTSIVAGEMDFVGMGMGLGLDSIA